MIQSLASRYGRPLASCLLFAWLAYLVTANQPKFELSVFPATVRLHILFGLLAAFYAAYLLAKRRLPGPTRLDLPIAGLLLVYAAATVDSIYPRVSIEFALQVGAAVLVLYAFDDLDFVTSRTLTHGLAAVGAIAATAALYRVAGDYLAWLRLIDSVSGGLSLSDLAPPAVPRAHGVGGNVNILAMALNLTLPFAMLLAARPAIRGERLLAILACTVILAGLFFTLSRGAWLGSFASISVLAGLYLLRERDASQMPALLRLSPRRAAFLAAPVVMVALLGAFLVAMRWDSRPDWLFRASLSPRYDAVQVGLEVFRDRPWFGAGPGTYPLLYNAYSGEYPVENIHPHNGYLNVLDDVGIAGAAFLLWGGVSLAVGMVRAFRDADRQQRLSLAACAAALTSLAVHSLVDSANAWYTALLPLAVVVALTLRLCRPSQVRQAAMAIAPRLLLAALLPLLLFSWLHLDQRHAGYQRSLADLRNGRFEAAADHSSTAASADSELAAAYLHAGVSRAILYLVQAERQPPAKAVHLEEAKLYFQAAINHDPRSAIAHANLALVLRMQAEVTGKAAFKHDAVEAARRAVQLAPADGTTAAAAGTVFEWADLAGEAIYAYSRAVLREPSLVQSPFWETNPFRSDVRLAALADFELSACEWGRASAIYAGFPDDLGQLAKDCRAEVDAKPSDPRLRAALAIILQALGRGDEARREAEDAARRVPDNPFVLTALAIVRGAAGDLAGARQQLARASSLRDPYDPDAALLLAYTYEPPPPGNKVLTNLHLPSERSEMPRPVVDRLRTAYEHAAPFVFDNGRQRYPLGILYYRVRFLRESPASILIPGEWLELSSPRALLIEEALTSK